MTIENSPLQNLSLVGVKSPKNLSGSIQYVYVGRHNSICRFCCHDTRFCCHDTCSSGELLPHRVIPAGVKGEGDRLDKQPGVFPSSGVPLVVGQSTGAVPSVSVYLIHTAGQVWNDVITIICVYMVDGVLCRNWTSLATG